MRVSSSTANILPSGDAQEMEMLNSWYNDLIWYQFDFADKSSEAKRTSKHLLAMEYDWKAELARKWAIEIDSRRVEIYKMLHK